MTMKPTGHPFSVKGSWRCNCRSPSEDKPQASSITLCSQITVKLQTPCHEGSPREVKCRRRQRSKPAGPVPFRSGFLLYESMTYSQIDGAIDHPAGFYTSGRNTLSFTVFSVPNRMRIWCKQMPRAGCDAQCASDGRARLQPGGDVCQWLQLCGAGHPRDETNGSFLMCRETDDRSLRPPLPLSYPRPPGCEFMKINWRL